MIDTLPSTVAAALGGLVVARPRCATFSSASPVGSLPLGTRMWALDAPAGADAAVLGGSDDIAGTDHTTGLRPRAAPV